MQITQAPPLPPASTAAVQPQAVQNGLTSIATQAVAPITHQALAPTSKSDKGQKSRRRSKDREGSPQQEEGRGGHVNISV